MPLKGCVGMIISSVSCNGEKVMENVQNERYLGNNQPVIMSKLIWTLNQRNLKVEKNYNLTIRNLNTSINDIKELLLTFQM